MSKNVPEIHFLFKEYFFIVSIEESPSIDSFEVDNLIFSPDIGSKNSLDLSNPPVVPIGVCTTSESKQKNENSVVPVHRHLPFTQAPFLLQWKGQVSLLPQ